MKAKVCTGPMVSAFVQGNRWAMRRLRGFAELVAVLVILVPCSLHAQGALGQNEPPLKKPDQTTIAALKKRIPELLKESSVPGLSLALIRDEKTYWVQGFGVRDAKTGQPVTDDTIFEAASLSKPVFTYGVLKLVDQGKLDLDTPLTCYLPKAVYRGRRAVGKDHGTNCVEPSHGISEWRPGDGPDHFTPGERFSYSGEGFVYLAKVVEQITGKPLNDYMTEAAFQPLGMKNNSYVWRPDYDARTATAHDASGRRGEKWKPTR